MRDRRVVRGAQARAGEAVRRAWPALAGALLVSGCTSAGAPTIALFGAYFPSWLACTVAGILGAVIVRVAFVRAGIDDALPVRLPVYLCVAAIIGFLVSLLSFGR